MSYDHETCLVITRHVLWSQDMYCNHMTYLVITRHVLWSQNMSWGQKTCLVITRHVSWLQDMFCDHKTCLVITRHVSWLQHMCCDHKTCFVITRHVSWSQHMFHVLITRHVLWLQDKSCDQKTCLVITKHGLWSQDMHCDHKTCIVLLKIMIVLENHMPITQSSDDQRDTSMFTWASWACECVVPLLLASLSILAHVENGGMAESSSSADQKVIMESEWHVAIPSIGSHCVCLPAGVHNYIHDCILIQMLPNAWVKSQVIRIVRSPWWKAARLVHSYSGPWYNLFVYKYMYTHAHVHTYMNVRTNTRIYTLADAYAHVRSNTHARQPQTEILCTCRPYEQ